MSATTAPLRASTLPPGGLAARMRAAAAMRSRWADNGGARAGESDAPRPSRDAAAAAGSAERTQRWSEDTAASCGRRAASSPILTACEGGVDAEIATAPTVIGVLPDGRHLVAIDGDGVLVGGVRVQPVDLSRLASAPVDVARQTVLSVPRCTGSGSRGGNTGRRFVTLERPSTLLRSETKTERAQHTTRSEQRPPAGSTEPVRTTIVHVVKTQVTTVTTSEVGRQVRSVPCQVRLPPGRSALQRLDDRALGRSVRKGSDPPAAWRSLSRGASGIDRSRSEGPSRSPSPLPPKAVVSEVGAVVNLGLAACDTPRAQDERAASRGRAATSAALRGLRCLSAGPFASKARREEVAAQRRLELGVMRFR